jgi:hypothetical protein
MKNLCKAQEEDQLNIQLLSTYNERFKKQQLLNFEVRAKQAPLDVGY